MRSGDTIASVDFSWKPWDTGAGAWRDLTGDLRAPHTAFPAWSAVAYLHLSWVDFTGLSFGVDLH